MVIADYWGCPLVGAFEEIYLQIAHALIVSEHEQVVSETTNIDNLELLCDSLGDDANWLNNTRDHDPLLAIPPGMNPSGGRHWDSSASVAKYSAINGHQSLKRFLTGAMRSCPAPMF